MKSTDKINRPEAYWCVLLGIRNYKEARKLVLVGGVFQNTKNLREFDGIVMDFLEGFDEKLDGVSN